LDVEEKVRARDVQGKKAVEAISSAHVVQKGPQNSHKKKFKQELKQKNTTPFKKKKKNQQNKRKGQVLYLWCRGTLCRRMREEHV